MNILYPTIIKMIAAKPSFYKYWAHANPKKLIYIIGLLTMATTILCSCDKPHATAINDEEYEYQTQTASNDGIIVLEAVASIGNISEVPREVVVPITAGQSWLNVDPNTFSSSELASMERRAGLQNLVAAPNEEVRNQVETTN